MPKRKAPVFESEEQQLHYRQITPQFDELLRHASTAGADVLVGDQITLRGIS